MKNNATLLLLIVSFFFHTNAKAFSQGITIKVTDATLDKVFSLIQKQTNFVFVYSGKQLAGTKKVSVDVTNEKFEKVMQMVMDGQPLRWEVDKEYVIIKERFPANIDYEGIRPGELNGKVINERGEPVAGATVTVKNSNINAATNTDGSFTLRGIDLQAELIVTSIGYEPRIVKLDGSEKISIRMIVSPQTIKEVVVKGFTGYSAIEKTNPGSVEVISNGLINRKVGSDILSRIENLVPGVLFNKGSSPDPLLIRGRSSIYSDVTPLIVVDNFPYDGPIENINPNDVENITILKDAAAASVWGARAGNGVIVITTKRGKANKPEVQFNSNISLKKRPDLFNMPIISSSDFIELEKFWFEQGLYNDDEFNNDNNWSRTPFTPVVELLLAKRKGTISPSFADQEIEALKRADVRSDIQKYFYQNSIAQQYSLNVSGNNSLVNYYLSAGYDRTKSELVGNNSDRFTMRSRNTFKVTNNLQIDAGINYSFSTNKGGSNPGVSLSSGGRGLYPYAKLLGKNGEALPLVSSLRGLYVDTAGGGKLLDWTYRPYEDIDKTTVLSKTRDFTINAGLRYALNSKLTAEVKYQFLNSFYTSDALQSQDAYSVRNLINSFSQIDVNGIVSYPVPKGGILDVSTNEVISHQGRLQLSYNSKINEIHEISSFVGWEIKDLTSKGNSYRMYGYNRKGSLVSPVVDYITDFPQYYLDGLTARISNSQTVSEQTDRFISYYGNIFYTYDKKYTLSVSGRNDAANLFGAKTNKQRGVPLWSAGLSWQINNEQFYNWQVLPSLRFRMTYGTSGNLPRTTTVTTISTAFSNSTQQVRATITNPPNEKLKWEQIKTFNIGIDFASKKDRIVGSIEFFKKDAKDVLGEMRVSPTLGVGSSVVANIANMKGHGIEIMVTSKNIVRAIQWSTTFVFSSAYSEVSKYLKNPSIKGATYIDGGIVPVEGRPVFSMYSYSWGGLDPSNGNPRGYLGKELSSDYSSIIDKTTYDSLKYSGSRQPNYFGAIMNSIQWKNLAISFNVSYKLDYFMRVGSVSYSSLFSNWTGHSDFAKRWKKSGDENFTSVPSMVFPYDNSRDQFYLGSEVLVKNAGQVRLDDIRLNYNFSSGKSKNRFKEMNLYAYSTLDILLWKANKDRIDPDYYGSLRPGKSFAIGLNLSF